MRNNNLGFQKILEWVTLFLVMFSENRIVPGKLVDFLLMAVYLLPVVASEKVRNFTCSSVYTWSLKIYALSMMTLQDLEKCGCACLSN